MVLAYAAGAVEVIFPAIACSASAFPMRGARFPLLWLTGLMLLVP